MPGVTVTGLVLIGVQLAAITAVLVLAYESQPAAPAPRQPVPAHSRLDCGHGPLTVELSAAWPIGRAGLTGPSAWLTAPRETAGFAVRRAAILAAYDRANAAMPDYDPAGEWPL